jgi:hypothetical protein
MKQVYNMTAVTGTIVVTVAILACLQVAASNILISGKG